MKKILIGIDKKLKSNIFCNKLVKNAIFVKAIYYLLLRYLSFWITDKPLKMCSSSSRVLFLNKHNEKIKFNWFKI